MNKQRAQQRPKRHVQAVQNLRKSNAAGVHGENRYNRRSKYPTDYFDFEEDYV